MAIMSDLVVDQFGAYISKHQGRLRVSVKGERVAEAPILHLERVVVSGQGVSLSSDAIAACCLEGIPIHFLDSRGAPYASLYSPGLIGTVLSRRGQLAAYLDARGTHVGIALAAAKVTNQAALLRYVAKYRKEADPPKHAALSAAADSVLAHREELLRLGDAPVDEVRELILAAEGRAARYYWDAWGLVLPEEYGWTGRTHREAKDPVNAALNYGYGILYTCVERAIVLAGLDPYAGYVHADRPGKPSLVYDLIEPYRPVAVDRVVLAMANRHMPLVLDERNLLTDDSRRLVAERVLKRLESPERYEGKRVGLRAIVQHEARHLATFLRGDRETYEAFLVSW